MKINWDIKKEDIPVISAIAKRAVEMFELKDKQGMEMDITATHLNGTPLKLQELLDANDFNFAHDIVGIIRNINRRNGKLDNHFSPRFSA